MNRVTADSNSYVSVLIFGDKPLQLLEFAIDDEIELGISDALR